MTTTTTTTHARRFVRAIPDPAWTVYTTRDHDTLDLALVAAEVAAYEGALGCASCGASRPHRAPEEAPWTLGALTDTQAEHVYGFGVCAVCVSRSGRDPVALWDRVDAAFAGAQ